MARVKGAIMTRKRRKSVLKAAKGYWGAKSTHFKMAKQAVLKSGNYAYVGRKQKKRNFRQLWITRISAQAKVNGLNYSTLMHEFGHFADGFINYGEDASIDRQEISSQALELLSLRYMNGILDESDIKYLQYSSMYSALETLLFQGFYARFEELAYAIPYDQISEEALNSAVVLAAYEFGLNTAYVNDITVAFIPHIFLYPFYVQSYCTSLIPALQFYFMEIDEAGSGVEAYKAYIDRNETDYDFEESLESAGLTSPFSENTVQEIVAKIYYEITGSRYSPEGVGGGSSAA